MKKLNSMKFSNILQINKPEYIFLKIKPSNSIRNNNTHKFARTINGLYKTILQNVKKEEQKIVKFMGRDYFLPTKLSIQLNGKVGYYIYIESRKVEFYFIIPKHHVTAFREKLSDVWQGVTIETVDSVPSFGDSATKYHLSYYMEDGLSLATDRRNNELLVSNINIIEVLEDGDKAGIFYNFMPMPQKSWKFKYKHTVDRVKNGLPVERNKMGWKYIAKSGINLIEGIMNALSETISGSVISKGDKLSSGIMGRTTIGDSTVKKGSSLAIDTQILVMCESGDKIRQRSAALSLVQSFDAIREDNELVYKPYRKSFSPITYSIQSADRNKCGDLEIQNFISLAGREILEQYSFIEKIETYETEVPLDLQKGYISIGENRFKGKDTPAFLSSDPRLTNLLTLLIGPSRAGKSNLIANMCIDMINAGECVIIFDFIENCELSDEISACIPKDRILNVDCTDDNKRQGFGYNEVGISEKIFDQYENAKVQTSNLLELVGAIHTDSARMSPKMERYLESAGLVVFLFNGSFKDVFGVLQNFTIRKQFLDKVPVEQYENLQEYMDCLRELDKPAKGETVAEETKTNSIIGIIDRMNVLKRNAFMEKMLKKDTKGNFNLIEEMQKNQLICIRLPQVLFTTDKERDVACLYWMTKIWLAAQCRADQVRDKLKRVKVNLIVDEMYQIEYTEKFMASKIPQAAKFIIKPIVSCHYINQIKYMREQLRSANASYILIAGCDEDNYTELKSSLLPYSGEDLRNLKPFHALCLLKNEQGYTRFITRLPGLVEDRLKKMKKVGTDSNTPKIPIPIEVGAH